ncbi:MAG: TatD family hydrolase [Rhodospirillaceae bacterium]|jgi:TatD DNase family protein|nr:TatD family hydrolase [Rhodospirillaceae bacterium]MBT3883913.1 TatD family hydrolase [Rhodospirillaceae bacterium]MBT4115142.1 TatD family hydrolase [Rhodospirillaceae bacterium]MBT4674364.1 TatD family hydrolase [Rhodospirillaceae bacterium]MBT4717786.1 TatD family hydrolase [Rhodospirillaceae bacterium]
MIVDSHCHLNFPEMVEDLPGILERAASVGVTHMVCICSYIDEFAAIRAMAEAHDNIFCSVGVHPHDAGREAPVTLNQLLDHAEHPKVIGIGETGLDFYYDKSPRDIQEANFRVHIEAARQTGLPIIVHTRDADEKTMEILGEEYKKGPFPGLIHCFTAGADLARMVLDIGFYISFSGIVTFNNAGDLRDIAKTVPLDRILVETDAPFLAPVPERGKRNEPAFVVHTAAKVAELLDQTPEDMARISSDNFFTAFAKATAT